MKSVRPAAPVSPSCSARCSRRCCVAPALGDVAHDSRVDGRVGSLHPRDRELDRELRPVAAHRGHLEPPAEDPPVCPGESLPVAPAQRRGDDQLGHVAAERLGARPAECRLRRRVELHHAALVVDRDDRVERGREHRPHTRPQPDPARTPPCTCSSWKAPLPRAERYSSDSASCNRSARMRGLGHGIRHRHHAARVVQPHRRAPARRRRDGGARGRPGDRGRRGRGAALLGGAAGRRARPLHAPRRPGDHRLARRAVGAAHPRAGQAAQRVLCDGAAADDRRAPLDRGRRAGDPRRREGGAADLPQAEEREVRVRAARRGRGDRAVELPVVDPLRRGGDRADVRQRRGAQAGVAHPADRPAHPVGVRARGPARGPGAHRARRRRRGPGAGGVERGEDLLHRLGGGRPRRGDGVRGADEGLGAGAGRQGPDAGAGRRQPVERRGRRPLGRLRQRRPDLLGHRAGVRGAGGGRGLHRGAGGGREQAARGRPDGLADRDRADGLARAVRAGARAGGRRGGGRRGAALRRARQRPTRATTSRPPCSPA